MGPACGNACEYGLRLRAIQGKGLAIAAGGGHNNSLTRSDGLGLARIRKDFLHEAASRS